MGKRIFITGGSGCVGHYLADALIHQTDHELFFLVRHPHKLRFDGAYRPGVQVLTGDVRDESVYAALLPSVQVAILLATQWGGEGTFAVNVDANLRIMQLLDPQVCEQVMYFSTASILDRQLRVLPQAKTLGTEYIRSKCACYEALPTLPIYDRITVFFPTLIFGGDQDKPLSHVATGLHQLPRYLRWVRWLRADGCFHFIHAQDIAQVVLHYLERPAREFRQCVLGNEVIGINEAVRELCDYFGLSVPPWQFHLTPRRVAWLMRVARWLGVPFIPRDDFCAQYRYFCYEPVVHPGRLGLTPYCQNLRELLQVLGIPPASRLAPKNS